MSDLTLTMLAAPTAALGTPPVLVPGDAGEPAVAVTDLGLNRGDGIFEVAGCQEGRVHALEAHLARFARSAAQLDLPAPNLEHYAAAVHRSVGELTARHPRRELLVKFALTRGPEMGDLSAGPLGWALAYPAPDYARDRVGIDVVTLSRGVASDVVDAAPWLLAGAKTLSYAANKAAVREAKRRGADDALFVSTDGYVLEGPNASFIARVNGELVTPDPAQGVLRGTTQADVFAFAARRGIPTTMRPMRVDELDAVDAAWFTSSGRLIAPVRRLDGRALPGDAAFTADALAYLAARG